MIASILQLSEPVFTAFLGALALLSLLIGAKYGAFRSRLYYGRKQREMEGSNQDLQKGMRRLWEEDKKKLNEENTALRLSLESAEGKLEDYRKKVAGMGMLNFAGSKKRSDILYSLLLENEALEQLLAMQGQKMATETQNHLNDKLNDIRKRQRLLAEIFNDETIKNYVRETLSEQGAAEETAKNSTAAPPDQQQNITE